MKLLIFFGFLSIVVGAVCFGNIKNVNYGNVFLLPIMFGLFLIVVSTYLVKLKKFIIFWILLFQQVIRYVFVPVLFIFEEHLQIGNTALSADYAITMMILELAIVFVAYSLIKNSHTIRKGPQLHLNFIKINFFSLFCFVLSLFIIIGSSSFLKKINFIWDFASYVELKAHGELEVENISPLLTLSFPLMRTFIVLFLWSWFRSLNLNSKLTLFLSILVLLLNASIIVGTSRFSIVYATFPLVLILIVYYSKYKVRIINFSLIVFSIILLVSSLTKFSRSDSVAQANDFFTIYQLNAYFSGVVNYSVGFDAYNTKHVKFYERRQYFVADILQNIPLLSKFSDQKYKTNILFNNEIYGNFRARDQIVPISIAGLFHFSILFFAYPFLLTVVAFWFEVKANKQSIPLLFFLYISLAVTCGTWMMVNIGTVVADLFLYLLVFIPILSYYHKRFRLSVKG